jgi:hypothetical protein
MIKDDNIRDIIAKELAKEITDELFRNGNNDIAKRLVLELPDKTDGGGWSQTAAASHAEKVITEWFSQTFGKSPSPWKNRSQNSENI